MTIDHETFSVEHAEFAPPAAWDAIPGRYAEHVGAKRAAVAGQGA